MLEVPEVRSQHLAQFSDHFRITAEMLNLKCCPQGESAAQSLLKLIQPLFKVIDHPAPAEPVIGPDDIAEKISSLRNPFDPITGF